MISGGTVRGCGVHGGLIGIDADNATVTGCRLERNDHFGIRAAGLCVVEGNACSGAGSTTNLGAAIRVKFGENRIENNTVTLSRFGIWDGGENDLVTRNAASQNETNYWVLNPARSTWGPISSTATDHPWANIEMDIPGDRFERNETQQTATDLGLVDRRGEARLSIDSPTDIDWYRLTAAGDGTLTATVLFQHAAGDLDIGLHDADGRLLRTSTTSTDNESVAVTATMGTNAYLRVFGYSGATNAYDLVINGPGL